MDIYNGDIIAMVSTQVTMQIHLFTALKKYWNELISNPLKPLNNKSISGLYPPGSTIKTIVALSALENDIISPNMNVECKGVIEFTVKNSIVGKKVME